MKKIILTLLSLLILSSCGQDEKLVEIQKTGEKIQILALGDSLTAGYGVKLENSYPSQLQALLLEKYDVMNAGVSGDTSAQLLARIDSYLEDKQNLPGIAIVTIGGNDGLRKLSLDNLEKNISSIIDKLKEKNIVVVLSGMRLPINFGLSYSRDFKKLYQKIADDKDIYFLEYFLEDVEGIYGLNQTDRIHPNKQGYTIITENMYNFLVENGLVK